MLNEDLRILFALEPAWTVSINGSEFVPASAAEIEIQDSTLRFKRQNRKILGIDWLRPNVPRIRTHADVLTFYPGSALPDKIEIEDVAVPFKRSWLGLLACISKLEFP